MTPGPTSDPRPPRSPRIVDIQRQPLGYGTSRPASGARRDKANAQRLPRGLRQSRRHAPRTDDTPATEYGRPNRMIAVAPPGTRD